jgi:hypothetical protein
MTARFCDFINALSSAADPISVEQETSGHGACVRFGAPAPLALDELAKEAGNYGDRHGSRARKPAGRCLIAVTARFQIDCGSDAMRFVFALDHWDSAGTPAMVKLAGPPVAGNVRQI